MATKKKGTAKGGADSVVVDFGAMQESEGGGKRFPENDYVGQIIKAGRDVSSEKGSPCIKLTLKIAEGRYEGKKVVERIWLSPKALPRLADLLEILGVKVPKSEIAIPLKKLVGKTIGFTLEDEEYDGKIRSRVAWDFLDPDDVRGSGDDDEDDDDLDMDDEDDLAVDEDDEDEDDEDDVELDEMSRTELKAYIKENSLSIKVKKGMDEDAIREAIEEAEGDDDDEDDEDELDSLDLEEL